MRSFSWQPLQRLGACLKSKSRWQPRQPTVWCFCGRMQVQNEWSNLAGFHAVTVWQPSHGAVVPPWACSWQAMHASFGFRCAPRWWQSAHCDLAWPPSIESRCSSRGWSGGFHAVEPWHAAQPAPSWPWCGSWWQPAQLSPIWSIGLVWQVLQATFWCAPTSERPVSAWSNEARAATLVMSASGPWCSP